MKAIYTKIDDRVFKINQSTGIPTSVTYRASGTSSTLQIDASNKIVRQLICINTLEAPGTKSNAQMYKELVEYLEEQTITEIDNIQNYFKAHIDYSIFNNGKEIEHAQVIRPIEAIDKALILGVATNNECVYRRVKTFNPKIDFKLRNPLPHGIMNKSKDECVLKINNIAIFQSLNEFNEVHNSTYEVSYDVPSSVINSSVDDSMMVYSSYNSGVDIQEIRLNFIPRHIEISLDVILTNYIVAYNDIDITDILVENIEKKYAEESQDNDVDAPDDGSEDTILIPDNDSKEPADGDYEPDEDGYYSWYERCTSTTPNALLVVENLMPDSVYEIDTMIKKKYGY